MLKPHTQLTCQARPQLAVNRWYEFERDGWLSHRQLRTHYKDFDANYSVSFTLYINAGTSQLTDKASIKKPREDDRNIWSQVPTYPGLRNLLGMQKQLLHSPLARLIRRCSPWPRNSLGSCININFCPIHVIPSSPLTTNRSPAAQQQAEFQKPTSVYYAPYTTPAKTALVTISDVFGLNYDFEKNFSLNCVEAASGSNLTNSSSLQERIGLKIHSI